MKQILSGKTLSEETVAYAQSLDLDVQCIDFIETISLAPELSTLTQNSFDSIAFTSSNAVNFFVMNPYCKELLKTKSIFSISGKTANSLMKLGVKLALTASNASTLADKIVKTNFKSVLHPCGNLKLDSLAIKLKEAHIKYNPLLVYETVLNKNIKLNKVYDAIMFYSPSGVESFFSANEWITITIACCIGETTAEAFQKKQQGATIITPGLPTPESMLKAIDNYFQKHTTTT